MRIRVGRLFRDSIAIVTTACVISSGCSRGHYRTRADNEASDLIREKNCDPRWKVEDLTVYSDPRSRFYDPYCPDQPPMPPDDPASHCFMHELYKFKHTKKWRRFGEIDNVQSPEWESLLPSYAPLDEEGKVRLDLPTATTLARIHNADYQNNIEEVYLAALDVAFERFRFDVQYFGNSTTGMRVRGNEPAAIIGAIAPGNAGRSTSTLTQQESFGFTRRFASGADLLVGFANSFVWQFSGENTNFATSLVNFSLVQPLLRNGGKAVVLEQLTRAERALLAAIRSQAQYRTEFFKSIAIGGGTTISPNRIGGFFGGAGLSGFTGVGQGGFGGVGAGQNFGGTTRAVGASGAGGGAGLAGGGEGTVGGFYGLVQQMQAIRNTEASLTSQSLTLDLLEANFEAGLIDLVQVDEFRQNIETEKASLLRAKVSLRDSLENYLINTIGLPADLPVSIDDSLVKRFQFIDRGLTELEGRASALMKEYGALPAAPSAADVQRLGRTTAGLLGDAIARVGDVEADHRKLLGERESLLGKIEDPERRKAFEEDLKTIGDAVTSLKTRLAGVGPELKKTHDTQAAGGEKRSIDALVKSTRTISNMLQEASLLQARVRVNRVFVDPIRLEPDRAVEIARRNRLDWMNRRASVVDQWRLIEFNANRLLSNLSIQLDGDMGTIGDRPLNFRAPTGSLRARLVFDAPLNRKSERNLYRESIINYQQIKRAYINYVDRNVLALRSRLRQLDRLRANLEIQRRALFIAIRRVDQTLEEFNKPLPTARPGEPPPTLGPTLSQNLLRAIADLRNTQDNFMSVWLNHESSRLNLLFELGLLKVDESGAFVDRPIDELISESTSECAESATPSPSQEFLAKLDDGILRGKTRADRIEDDLLDHEVGTLIKLPEQVERKLVERAASGGRAELENVEFTPAAPSTASAPAPVTTARSRPESGRWLPLPGGTDAASAGVDLGVRQADVRDDDIPPASASDPSLPDGHDVKPLPATLSASPFGRTRTVAEPISSPGRRDTSDDAAPAGTGSAIEESLGGGANEPGPSFLNRVRQRGGDTSMSPEEAGRPVTSAQPPSTGASQRRAAVDRALPPTPGGAVKSPAPTGAEQPGTLARFSKAVTDSLRKRQAEPTFEEFLGAMEKVRPHAEQGRTVDEIVARTGISRELVLACLVAGSRASTRAVNQLPTRGGTVQITDETAPGSP
jgi:hypothetical protein